MAHRTAKQLRRALGSNTRGANYFKLPTSGLAWVQLPDGTWGQQRVRKYIRVLDPECPRAIIQSAKRALRNAHAHGALACAAAISASALNVEALRKLHLEEAA